MRIGSSPVMHVCVLGAGIIGAATAYYLARDGHRVSVVDKAHGAGLQSSFANGGQLSYNYVAPLADPSIVRKLPGWLWNPDSPLRFMPRFEPDQWLWCLSFLRACRATTAHQVTAQLLSLSRYSRSLTHQLTHEESLDFQYGRNGKLVVYRSKPDLRLAIEQMHRQSLLGSEQEALDPLACATVEPALCAITDQIVGGIYTPSDEVGDCFKLVAELERVATAKYGVTFQFCTKVEAIRPQGRRVVAVITDRGDIAADAFIVATGTGSRELLHPLGLSLPIYPLGGYSVTVPIERNHRPPRISVTDAHNKIVCARLGDRLRVAGMVDIAGRELQADPARVSLLIRQARESFPYCGDYDRAEGWFGHRPATPLGRPILGATPFENLWLNTGHGGLGFTLACASGRLVADCVSGKQLPLDLSDFALAKSSCRSLGKWRRT